MKRFVQLYDGYVAANGEFSDDFPQYLAATARELAESGRRTERAIEKMGAVTAAIQRDSKLAREALHAVASGLSDFNETSYEATDRATKALVEFYEQSKDEMRRLVEVSDMLAAYLSASRDEGSAPEDEDPEPEPEDEDPE